MVETTVEAYEKLIQQKVASKISDYHDYEDCCQECRIRVWQSFGKYSTEGNNGMSLKSWVSLQIDSAISNFLRDTYYTERAKREIPYGLLLDMELLFSDRRLEEVEEPDLSLLRDRGVDREILSDRFKRWTDSREREETEFKELDEEILRNLKPMQVEIYKRLKEGYTQREIAASLDHGTVSQPYIHKQITAIKKVVLRILNRRKFF